MRAQNLALRSSACLSLLWHSGSNGRGDNLQRISKYILTVGYAHRTDLWEREPTDGSNGLGRAEVSLRK
jgi:hypothetical protein